MMQIRSKWKFLEICFLSNSLRMYYSTETQPQMNLSCLESHISRSGNPTISMIPILNQWIEEGGDVTQPVLTRIISRLTHHRRFTHALQVSEWMSNNQNYDLSPGDIARRLSLISKVHGLEQAETFYKGIPDAKIGFKIYAALLSCYAEHKSLEEAEVLMKKIKKLHPVHISVFYNMMLKLYGRTGNYEKMDSLIQEMKEKDVCHGATFTIRLNAYADAKDVEGLEKLLMQMEADPIATVDWYTYATAANGYVKVGNVEKASEMLKKSEILVRGASKRAAYESLITMHAAIGNKDDVYRLWNRCKTIKNSLNSSYLSMLRSLVKLDDIDGAEKILQEWESEHKHFDIRLPNLMINSYCRWGLVDKAEAYIKRLLDNGNELEEGTWDCLSTAYRTMKKGTLTNRRGWRPRPDPFTLVACIKYLKEKDDAESALEIIKLVKENGHISVTTYDKLVSCVHSETLDTEAFDLINQDYQLDENMQLRDGEK